MTAKEGLKTKEYIELRMPEDKRSNVKGASKAETEVRLTADTAKTHEQIIPPFCRICFDESSSPQAPVLDPSSKSSGPLRPQTTHSSDPACAQNVSPSELPSVNDPPTTARRQFFRRLFLMIMLLCFQCIPIIIVVLIMTIQVEEPQQPTPNDELSSTGLGLFGRAILSVSVCLLYIPLLYVCLFKSRMILKPSRNGRRTRRYSSMQSSHNSYMWHRRHDDRNYYLEAAFI